MTLNRSRLFRRPGLLGRLEGHLEAVRTGPDTIRNTRTASRSGTIRPRQPACTPEPSRSGRRARRPVLRSRRTDEETRSIQTAGDRYNVSLGALTRPGPMACRTRRSCRLRTSRGREHGESPLGAARRSGARRTRPAPRPRRRQRRRLEAQRRRTRRIGDTTGQGDRGRQANAHASCTDGGTMLAPPGA